MENLQQKHTYLHRPAAMEKEQFFGQVVRPLLAQVAAGNVRKNHAMVLAALCGNINLLPIHANYKGATNPLYSFYAVLSQIKMQPVRQGKNPSSSQTVYPAQIGLYQLHLPVVAQLNEMHDVPEKLIDCFLTYCKLVGADPAPFIAGADQVEISYPLMSAIAYWACDQAAWQPHQPPMTLVPKVYKHKPPKKIIFLANENE